MDRRKQLKDEYKLRKPPMGVLDFYCKASGQSYLVCAPDITATINSIKMRLGFNGNMNKALQADWQRYGESGFDIRVAASLDYEENHEGDYTDELLLLRMELMEQNPSAIAFNKSHKGL